jgi:hypothetical protein
VLGLAKRLDPTYNCNSEFDATVFRIRAEQTQSRPMSLSSLRFQPLRHASCCDRNQFQFSSSKKYRRSAMENVTRLQCKALRKREKQRQRKNNGYQWKSNAKNNGNNENTGGSDYVRLCRRKTGAGASRESSFAATLRLEKQSAPGAVRLRTREYHSALTAMPRSRRECKQDSIYSVYSHGKG